MRFLTIILVLAAFLPAQSETPSSKIRASLIHRVCSGLKRVDREKSFVAIEHGFLTTGYAGVIAAGVFDERWNITEDFHFRQ